jgi:hypothetical protein
VLNYNKGEFEMAKTWGISEILYEVSKIKDFETRKNALATAKDNTVLLQILHAVFNPNVKFLLPEGTPPYKPTEKSLDLQSSLYRESKKMYYFIDGVSPNIPQLKRETMFVQMLEVLDPDDAKLVIAMKDKKMPYSGITYDLVSQTFPDMLPTLSPEQKVAVEDRKPKNQRVRKAVPCPHGCKSSHEDGLFAVQGLPVHLKTVHGSSDKGVEVK